jgi:uncharacterized protein YecT (DUF1311 family)
MRSKRNSLYALMLAIALFFFGCDRYFANPTSPSSGQPSNSVTPDLVSPAPSASVPIKPSPSDDWVAQLPDCVELQTQAEMTDCAASQAKSADEKLNQIYQSIQTELKGSAREELLIDAQLAWIEFRDKNCAFAQSQFEGGSIEPMIYNVCIERVTKQRTEELQNYLEEMVQ